jgi:hypothetical protein
VVLDLEVITTANVSLILSLYTDGVWSGGSSRYI